MDRRNGPADHIAFGGSDGEQPGGCGVPCGVGFMEKGGLLIHHLGLGAPVCVRCHECGLQIEALFAERLERRQRIIRGRATAYRPDPDMWTEDLMRRKK